MGHDPNNGDRIYPGMMDDLGFFDEELSEAEVASIMTNGVSSLLGDGRLVAAWTLDQSSGDVAVDAKNSIALQLQTLSPTFVPTGGQIDGALDFDAAQRNYGTFRSPSYDVGSSGTLALWVKPTDVGSQRHQMLDGGGMGFTIRNSDTYFYAVSGDGDTLTYTNDNSIAANTGRTWPTRGTTRPRQRIFTSTVWKQDMIRATTRHTQAGTVRPIRQTS